MSNYTIFPVRIYTEDTDVGGIVYHANYLKFAERARTEALRTLGESLSSLQGQGILLVVRSCFLNCLASARLDDVLEVRTYFKKLGHVKIEVIQDIVREDQLIATLEVVLACVNLSGKPIKINDHLRHLFIHSKDFKNPGRRPLIPDLIGDESRRVNHGSNLER